MKYASALFLALIWLNVITCLVSSMAHASPLQEKAALELTDQNQAFRLNAQKQAAAYFEVPANTGLGNITSVIQQITADSTVTIPNFEQHSHYGLFIALDNYTHTSQWILHVNRFLIDQIEVYVITEDGNSYFAANFKDGSDNDAIRSVFGHGIPISLPLESTARVLVILSADSFVPPVSLDLYSSGKYARVTEKANALFLFTMGIVFSSIAASLVCFFLLREMTFFWFAISSFLMALITLSRSYLGIVFFGLDNGLPDWFWLLICVTEICLLKFVLSFLSSDKDPLPLRRFYNRSFIIISSCIFMSLLLSELFLKPETMIMVSIFYGLLVTLIAVVLGVIYAFKLRKYYVLFVLGWLPIFFRIGEKAFALNVDPSYSSDAIIYNPSYDPVYQAVHFFGHLVAILLRFADHKKQQLEAETRSLAKTMFLASVSHDLRQPIHSMQLLTGHLEGEVQSQQGKSILSQLQQVQTTFDETFNALMDWSQLEAGKVSLNLEKADISKLLHDVKAEFTSMAVQKGIELRIQAPSYVVTTDPLLLRRIVRNLLSNALKYSQSGAVLMTCRCRKHSIVIEVWDTGCGIPDHEQPIIFDLYQRARHYKHQESGSGIGLANVKQLVDALGYKISLKSRVNTGSVFRIEIPDVENCIAQKNNQSKERIPRLTIANLIENVELKNKVNSYLHKWGYTTTNAADISRDSIADCIYFTDESSGLIEYLSNHIQQPDAAAVPQFIGSFSTLPFNNAATDKLKVHRLNPGVEPAELRAFIRYVEAQYLSV